MSAFELEGEQIILHPYGGLYWSEKKSLFVSDTHFGKVSHFRKNGIAIPMGAIQENWEKLASMIRYFDCTSLFFLGDLFHSEYNNEWEMFLSFKDAFAEIDIILIEGNHDILDKQLYVDAEISVFEKLEIAPFIFSHHPLENPSKYNIYGHIHPAVRLQGKAKQAMKVPCFYFGEREAILPAFGSFTGTAIVPMKQGDKAFLLVGEKLMEFK